MNDNKIITKAFVAGLFTTFIYSASAFILPVSLENIREELSLSLTQGGLFGSASAIVQFFVMISSCFISAHFGKIKTLRFGLLVLSLSLIVFSFINNYMLALVVYVFVGIGHGMLEALLTPFVQDLYPNDKGEKQNLLHSFWPLGSITSFLLTGFLLSKGVSWRYIFFGFAILTALVMFLYPSSKKISLPLSSTNLSHIKEIISNPIFWLFGLGIFCVGGAEYSFSFWLPTFIRTNFDKSALFGGIAASLFSLGLAIGRISVSHMAKHVGLFKIIIISVTLSLISSILFSVFNNIAYIYIMIFFTGLFMACQWPSLQTFAVTVLKNDATLIMVFLSCFGIPGTSTGTLVMGRLGDKYGLKKAFYAAPIYLILFLIVLIIVGLINKNKIKTQ